MNCAFTRMSTLVALVLTGVAVAGLGGDWITGYDNTVPETGKSKPALNEPFSDDVYGATIRRVSQPNEVSTQWVRHEYSRRQAFNTDGTRLIMFGNNGAWLLYDVAADGRVTFVSKLPSMSEPNWHPTDPHVFRFFPREGGLSIQEHDVSTGGTREVANFSDRLPWSDIRHVWTAEEGEPSADGRTWCLLAEDDSHVSRGMFSYDLQTDTILGTAGLSGDPNHISTSPSGDYCVPSGRNIGGTFAYSLDMRQSRLLHDSSEHSDVAIDANGRDVLVFADYGSGWVTMADMETGVKTELVRIYEIQGSGYALHLSGNSYRVPGYAVISTYGATLDKGATEATYGDIWGHDKLAIIELDDSPEIHNIAYMHNEYNGYWTEPHATVDLDLSKILFVSNWESGSDSDLSSYMVTLGNLDVGGGGGAETMLFSDGFE